jgi:hypothetical protein
MRNWINKSEAVKVLSEGGTLVSHDSYHFIYGSDGKCVGLIRYSLWNILTSPKSPITWKHAPGFPRREKRPPSPLPYYVWEPA